jgi:hypothetical protein
MVWASVGAAPPGSLAPAVVVKALRAEAPDAVSRLVGVAARAKISVGWAASMVWAVRYCLDWRGQLWALKGGRGTILNCTLDLEI